MHHTDEPSLREGLQFLKQGLLFALLVAAGAAVATYFFSKSQPPTYRTSATLLASQSDPDLKQFNLSLASAPPIDFSAYRSIALSNPVLSTARQLLEDETVLDRVSVAVNTEDMRISSFVRVNTTGQDPVAVSEAANAVAEALVAWDKNRARDNLARITTTLKEQITALKDQIRALQVTDGTLEEQNAARQRQLLERQDQLSYVSALSISAVGLLESIEPAPVPVSPIAPRPKRSALLAFGLGIFASYGLLLLRYTLDTRLRSSEDLVKLTGLSVLAEFPTRTRSSEAFWDAASYLRANLSVLMKDTPQKVIVITSALHTSEKSLVALTLAQSFARSGQRTLLVDADMRQPAIASLLNLGPKQATPLSVFLDNPHEQFTPASVPVAGDKELDVVPSFGTPPLPTELLTRGIQASLELWQKSYDVIVVDCAPLLAVPDALAILPHATGVAPVLNLQRASRREVVQAVDMLRRLDAWVLGLVLTNADEPSKRRSYGQKRYRSQKAGLPKLPGQVLPPGEQTRSL